MPNSPAQNASGQFEGESLPIATIFEPGNKRIK
jgi:hypothetical protein